MAPRTLLIAAVALLVAAAPAGAVGVRADERCAPALIAGGEPALVAVVMDGISSQELESGTSDPLAIPNWCPALPAGGERHFPDGLETGYRTWAGLATADGAKPHTQTCRPGGGLGTDTCLVGRLVDAGAIVLPYSYVGARVSGSAFTFPGYTSQDTFQDPAVSIDNLDRLLRSIATAWPAARVVILAHSFGGTVASGWWIDHAHDLGNVTHVFTLDSPINGVEQCAGTALIFSQVVADELCRRWNDRDAFDAGLLELDRPQTLTTIGTVDDPAYLPLAVTPDGLRLSGGGRLRPQVIYRCADAGEDPGSACVAAPPSVVNRDPECSGAGAGIQGRTGHFAVLACPQTTRTVLAAASTGVLITRRPNAGRGLDQPSSLPLSGQRLQTLRWKQWGGFVARGHGRLGGKRVAVALRRPRPCDAIHRFAYTRVKIAGRPVARRACPGAP
ncbi:MAG: hypothetical protein QOF76_3986 [Solirubrobacteraceae bacterium]|nr:hypothetical protein [Solirubrobacteraceae bacterium]